MATVAVITGSNGKIGQATRRRLAQSGYTVVGIDLGAAGETGSIVSTASRAGINGSMTKSLRRGLARMASG